MELSSEERQDRWRGLGYLFAEGFVVHIVLSEGMSLLFWAEWLMNFQQLNL